MDQNKDDKKRKVKLSELEKDNKDSKIIESNIKETTKHKTEKDDKPKEETEKKDTDKRKVVPLSEVAKQNQDKITKTKNKEIEATDEEKPKREKVKLDDLIKETKEKETKKKKEEDVIVSFNDKKQEAKNAIKKNKSIDEKSKSKSTIKEVHDKNKENDINDKTNKEKEEIKKEEVNLDVLGVKRKKEPSIVWQKIKETLITILLLFVGIVLVMLLPIFNVPNENLNITGLDLISRDEVLNVINYNKSSNLFHLLLNKPEETIINNIPMVNNCEVKFELPNTLNIRITEIRLAGYIPYLDQYIYIDSYGKVVSSQTEKIDGIPLIEGLNFSSLKVGNVLKVSNSEALNVIIEITNVLNKYDLSNLIDSIDVTSLDNLKLYVGNIEVILGEIDDYDQKIRMAIEAINNLSPEARGVLSVASTSGKIYFRPYS